MIDLSALVRTAALVLLAASALPVPAVAAKKAAGSVQLPLVFEPNQGQTDPKVRFLSRGGNYAMFLEDRGAVLKLPSDVLRFRWLGGKQAKLTAEHATGGVSNYLIGQSEAKWKTGIPQYSRVRYRGLYEGIDLEYYGRDGQLEYDLIVAPGADPDAIAFGVSGARRVRLQDGDLILSTSAGEIRQRRPVAYQEIARVRRNIDAKFRLGADGQVRFAIGDYDRAHPLVIDPVLVFSRAFGGSAADQIHAISPSGNVVAGSTMSADYPPSNGVQKTLAGSSDAFVAGLSGSSLRFATYIGGSGPDVARAVTDSICVTGETSSVDFPAYSPLRTKLRGPSDAFILELGQHRQAHRVLRIRGRLRIGDRPGHQAYPASVSPYQLRSFIRRDDDLAGL